ncbi:MAG: hypothetical protein EHM18_03065 [Acidobacteria bacterium]|nr:MAG: hypothetical protein EHM18_03065 [Acidobacteriota bacterium]
MKLGDEFRQALVEPASGLLISPRSAGRKEDDFTGAILTPNLLETSGELRYKRGGILCSDEIA